MNSDLSDATKTRHVVGVADLQVFSSVTETLITYNLGSCIGIAVYDSVVRAGGILHYMLPLSKANPERAEERPAMFGDTGIPCLFRAIYELGGTKKNLSVKVAGGAQILDRHDYFGIGKRNYIVLKKILWKNGINVAAADVGGTTPRTLSLDIETGEVGLLIGQLWRTL